MPSRAAADLSCGAQPRDGGLRVVADGAQAASLRPRGVEDRPGGVGPVASCRQAGEQRQPVRHARTLSLRLEVADAWPGQVDPRTGRAGPAVQDQRPLAVAGESYQSRSSPTESLSSGCHPRI
jgi:hypothetical protein